MNKIDFISFVSKMIPNYGRRKLEGITYKEMSKLFDEQKKLEKIVKKSKFCQFLLEP